ncbi:hypothetical protein CIHG_00522 [Coccidioides immitis H538.4]|uniref:Uncharacterized protein n=1 Tax=Coccidioides immitis H538.4 TaxID=396776 RepID=A0A0J8RC15_COCIT|nr:hypothetical protein CIHG_00522 [Coccidioides immitis H538.4]
MCRLLFSTYSDGPAMVLSPPYLHNADNILANNPTSVPPSRPQFPNPGSVSTSVNGIQSGPPRSSISRSGLSMSGSSSTPLSANPSRKRSHDEFNASNDDDASKPSTAQQPPFRSQTPEEPIYGEGMVLLNPRTGLALSAESQTGTWFEEKAEAEASAAPPVAVASGSGQPGLPSRKSQRLDSSASGWDDIAAASIHRKLQSSSHNDTYRNISSAGSTSTSTSGPQTPLVDDATRLLGNKLAAGEHRRQRHGGSSSWLGETSPRANLSARTGSPASHNLQSTPIAFEAGSEVMRAAERTPERLLGDQGILNGTIYMNGNGIKMGNEGMEMAMEIDR